jgi:hypothetical protein
MAVPNTSTFSLTDVRTEIANAGGGTLTSLTHAFTLATGTFDPAYQGDKDRLLNFRNYVHESSEDGVFQVAGHTSNDSYLSTDSGATWNVMIYGGDEVCGIAISASGKYIIIAARNYSYVSFSDNFGAGGSWVSKLFQGDWTGVDISETGQYITAVINGGYIWTSWDYGVNWVQRASSLGWLRIAVSGNGMYQLASTNVSTAAVYVSSNYGETWAPSGANGDWFDIAISADGTYMTKVDQPHYIWTSDDHGSTWAQRGLDLGYTSIGMSDSGTYQYALHDNLVYKSIDSGVTWNLVHTFPFAIYGRLAVSSDGSKLTTGVATGGYIYTSWDYGVSWTQRGTSLSWTAFDMNKV